MASTVMGNSLSSKGEIDVDIYARGEPGRGVSSTVLEYQVSADGTTVPTGAWSTSFPVVEQGKYLWTRITFTYNDDTSMVSYNISYFAIDGADGTDGTTFTPHVDANGNISWTNDGGKENPQTQNIKGPKGDAGSVKFEYVSVLPTSDIQTDTFYIKDAENPSSVKLYDEYFYINNGWEKLGEDLSAFYNKTQIDSMLADFVTTKVVVDAIAANTTYYLTGVDNVGNKPLKKSGFTYRKGESDAQGTGAIDGNEITVNLFYSIS